MCCGWCAWPTSSLGGGGSGGVKICGCGMSSGDFKIAGSVDLIWLSLSFVVQITWFDDAVWRMRFSFVKLEAVRQAGMLVVSDTSSQHQRGSDRSLVERRSLLSDLMPGQDATVDSCDAGSWRTRGVEAQKPWKVPMLREMLVNWQPIRAAAIRPFTIGDKKEKEKHFLLLNR